MVKRIADLCTWEVVQAVKGRSKLAQSSCCSAVFFTFSYCSIEGKKCILACTRHAQMNLRIPIFTKGGAV